MDAETRIYITWCFGEKSCHCVLSTITSIRL